MDIRNHPNYQMIEEIIKTEINLFLRPDLGELNFIELRPKIVFLKKSLSQLLLSNNDIVPDEVKMKILKKSSSIFNYLNAIKNFSIKNIQGNPNLEKQRIIGGLNSEYYELFQIIIPLLNLFVGADEEKIAEKKDALDKLIGESIDDINEKLERFNNKIVETTIAVRDATKSSGVSVFAEIFEVESKMYSKNAVWWLLGTASLLVITVGASIWLLYVQKEGEFGFDHIQFMITKVLIISALFYGISVCVKNYKAQKHNELVNRHRFNALKTFQTFTTSTKDERTKDVILLEATHTIFGHQTTGYNDNDSNDSDLPTKVLDAIKTSDKS